MAAYSAAETAVAEDACRGAARARLEVDVQRGGQPRELGLVGREHAARVAAHELQVARHDEQAVRVDDDGDLALAQRLYHLQRRPRLE